MFLLFVQFTLSKSLISFTYAGRTFVNIIFQLRSHAWDK